MIIMMIIVRLGIMFAELLVEMILAAVLINLC